MQADVILKESPPWLPPLRGGTRRGGGVTNPPLYAPESDSKIIRQLVLQAARSIPDFPLALGKALFKSFMQDTAQRIEESGFTLMHLVVFPVLEEYNKKLVLFHVLQVQKRNQMMDERYTWILRQRNYSKDMEYKLWR